MNLFHIGFMQAPTVIETTLNIAEFYWASSSTKVDFLQPESSFNDSTHRRADPTAHTRQGLYQSAQLFTILRNGCLDSVITTVSPRAYLMTPPFLPTRFIFGHSHSRSSLHQSTQLFTTLPHSYHRIILVRIILVLACPSRTVVSDTTCWT